MNNVRLICCIIWPCLFWAEGCEPKLATSEHPAVMQKVFLASPDRVWQCSLNLIQRQKGTILMEDKSLGLITCKIPDSLIAGPQSQSHFGEGWSKSPDWKVYPQPYIYLNIYIKQPSEGGSVAIVYAIPYDALSDFSYANAGPEKVVAFKDVTFRKNYESEVSSMFFEGLRTILKEAEL